MVPILRMDIRRILGLNVRRHRLAAGLSQEAVAVRMGVDRAFISSIERGQQNVTLLTLREIAEALKAQPSELLAEPVKDTAPRRS
jgi:transcriptional regulator with XRE-family HTH domain